MPELPEVETIVRDLRPQLVRRRIAHIEVPRADLLADPLTAEALEAALRGRAIQTLGRRGKNLLLGFEDGTRLLLNLGMTGRLLPSWAPGAALLGHIGVRFFLEEGGELLFDDIRRFGRIELHDRKSWLRRERTLGPEPLGRSFTAEGFNRMLSASRSPVRNKLLDQRRIAGIGNIYANEALARAGIHPARPAASLSPEEGSRLFSALRAVLREAIRARGTTFSDYRDGHGEKGEFSQLLRVYGRAGAVCDCGQAIRRLALSNRPIFFCPQCQPLPQQGPRGRPATASPTEPRCAAPVQRAAQPAQPLGNRQNRGGPDLRVR